MSSGFFYLRIWYRYLTLTTYQDWVSINSKDVVKLSYLNTIFHTFSFLGSSRFFRTSHSCLDCWKLRSIAISLIVLYNNQVYTYFSCDFALFFRSFTGWIYLVNQMLSLLGCHVTHVIHLYKIFTTTQVTYKYFFFIIRTEDGEWCMFSFVKCKLTCFYTQKRFFLS